MPLQLFSVDNLHGCAVMVLAVSAAQALTLAQCRHYDPLGAQLLTGQEDWHAATVEAVETLPGLIGVVRY